MADQIVPLVSPQKRTAIITRYANLQRELTLIKQQLEEAKVEAINLLGEGEYQTEVAKLTIKWISRPIFDQAKAKSFLTAGQLAQCAKPCEFFDIRVKVL